ncbi:MAG: DNA-binding response regulator [Comamonadaceae bacterium]|nr:DNA-binding response regulator [Comamonadaceae bacterium]
MDGIELAQHLARLRQPPAVIFATAYDQYAVEAFELNARRLPAQAGARRSASPPRCRRRSARRPLPRRRAATQLAPRRPRAHLSRAASAAASCWCRWPTSSTCKRRAEVRDRAHRRSASTCSRNRSPSWSRSSPQRFVRVHRNCLVARGAVAGFERDQRSGRRSALAGALLKGVAEKPAGQPPAVAGVEDYAGRSGTRREVADRP